MTLDELLEQFDEVLDSGIKIPGKKTLVDIEKLRAGDKEAGIPSYADKVRAFFRVGEEENT